MPADKLALVLAVVVLAVAIPPIQFAKRRHALYPTDIALTVAPTLMFSVAVYFLNEPAKTGLALLIYPLVVLALSVTALYLRVFVLGRFAVNLGRLSLALLVAACIAAFTLGTSVAPLYE